jgi:anti-sigma-K factor RskA
MNEKQERLCRQLQDAVKDACAGLTPLEGALVIAEAMRDAGMNVTISYDPETGKFTVLNAGAPT